ncbi:alpha/beta fold hydrolase [Streptomyces goshikiensis]|uniref:alpha/beta fold hydrolase n=1 Tax=Streptomyces goshikiensis TaxID=1942 RepID=UPI003616EF36
MKPPSRNGRSGSTAGPCPSPPRTPPAAGSARTTPGWSAPTRAGAPFAEVMHQAPDGWRPLFSRRQMLTARETWVHDAHWEELAQVRCPTLVVRGLDGELGRAEAQEMVRVLPAGQYAEIPDAGHYLHYDQPTAWRAALEPFLDGVKSGP